MLKETSLFRVYKSTLIASLPGPFLWLLIRLKNLTRIEQEWFILPSRKHPYLLYRKGGFERYKLLRLDRKPRTREFLKRSDRNFDIFTSFQINASVAHDGNVQNALSMYWHFSFGLRRSEESWHQLKHCRRWWPAEHCPQFYSTIPLSILYLSHIRKPFSR